MRDQRLDFWRGLCLIDMVLVHFAYEHVQFPWMSSAVFGEYTRFAAGGFVFVAGVSVGMIFLRRIGTDASLRWPTYRRLWRRAGFLLVVHYAAALAFVALTVQRGGAAWPDDPLQTLAGILTLRVLPEYGDILPLYVALLGLTPLLHEVQRRYGWLPIAAASTALVALGQAHPWWFSAHQGESFPLILWQVFFVGGLVFGTGFPAYRGAAVRYKLAVAALAWGALAIMVLYAHGASLGWTQAAPQGFVFRKVPLSLGMTCWYFTMILSVILTTDLLWERCCAGRAWTGFVSRLGRCSLPVYVGHVFTQALVMECIWRSGMPAAGQGALVVLDIAALWALAWVREQEPGRLWAAGERFAQGWLQPMAPLLGRLVPMAATAAAMFMLLQGGEKPGSDTAAAFDAGHAQETLVVSIDEAIAPPAQVLEYDRGYTEAAAGDLLPDLVLPDEAADEGTQAL